MDIAITISGNGPRRMLSLAARRGDEWNAVYVTLVRFTDLHWELNRLLDDRGRPARSVGQTVMTSVVIGIDGAAEERNFRGDADVARGSGVLIGGPARLGADPGRLREVWVQRVMARRLDTEEIDKLALLANVVLPEAKSCGRRLRKPGVTESPGASRCADPATGLSEEAASQNGCESGE